MPVGDYARQALARMHLSPALANVVSNEASVVGVVAKVRLGEADAGIVYVTDATAAAGDVRTIPIPPHAQPVIVYSAAVVSSTAHRTRAMAIIDTLTGATGHRPCAPPGSDHWPVTSP